MRVKYGPADFRNLHWRECRPENPAKKKSLYGSPTPPSQSRRNRATTKLRSPSIGKKKSTSVPLQVSYGQANLNGPKFVERFERKEFPECFREYADLVHWDHYWHTTLDTERPYLPFWKSSVGGRLNASYNCVDRRFEKWKNKAAFIFVPEPEEENHIVLTFQELYRRVNEVAAMFRRIRRPERGDRVTIHMPMIPDCRLPCSLARASA